MPVLTEEQKEFIVAELAMYSTPTEVCVAIKEQFDVDIRPNHVNEYNPLTKHKKPLAPKWVDLHTTTRTRFLENVSDIPIANRAFRLRRLDKLARNTKSPVLEAQLLEQAAKETGGSYTNRHEHTGRDGKDLPGPATQVVIYELPGNGR